MHYTFQWCATLILRLTMFFTCSRLISFSLDIANALNHGKFCHTSMHLVISGNDIHWSAVNIYHHSPIIPISSIKKTPTQTNKSLPALTNRGSGERIMRSLSQSGSRRASSEVSTRKALGMVSSRGNQISSMSLYIPWAAESDTQCTQVSSQSFQHPCFLFLSSQLYLWRSTFWVRFLCMWPFSIPTIKVLTFHLCGWRMLSVFLLPAFTRLGHACQDLLQYDHSHCIILTDWTLIPHAHSHLLQQLKHYPYQQYNENYVYLPLVKFEKTWT